MDELAWHSTGMWGLAQYHVALAQSLRRPIAQLTATFLPAQADAVLELDEMVSFVSEKWFKRWWWTAQCRRTRQIVAHAIGDRSTTTARQLWETLPEGYRSGPVFSDGFDGYPLIVPALQHHPLPQSSGQTNHQERWYNNLRQWVGRYTRRTLSCSKQDEYHSLVTHWFILEHNLRMASSRTI